MKLRVDSRLRIDLDDLASEAGGVSVAEEIAFRAKGLFEHDNSKGAEGEPPIIRTWREEGFELSFPRGGYRKLRALLAEARIRVEVEDAREPGADETIPDHRPPPHYRVGDPLWPHQERGVVAALATQNCILRAPTGSGKTSAAIAMIGRAKARALVVVSTKNLFDQWCERIERELGVEREAIGKIGDGKRHVRPITVALEQTLARGVDAELLEHFGMVVADEIDLFAAKTFVASIDPWPAKYRIGIGADERRRDGKEFLIYDLFGRVAAEIGERELVDAGVVVDVEVRVVPTSYEAPWYRRAMAAGGWTAKRAIHKLATEIATDENRLELAVSILRREIDEGKQVFALCERVEHARRIDRELVAAGVPSGTLIGGDSAIFDETKDGMRAGRIRAGCGTIKAIGRAFDMPRIEAAVVAAPIGKNEQLFNQARGRVCRSAPGKAGGRLYYLWDREVYGYAVLERIAKRYEGVVVLDEGEWTPARDYLRRAKRKAG